MLKIGGQLQINKDHFATLKLLASRDEVSIESVISAILYGYLKEVKLCLKLTTYKSGAIMECCLLEKHDIPCIYTRHVGYKKNAYMS